jgi:hypothetical protein
LRQLKTQTTTNREARNKRAEYKEMKKIHSSTN